MDFVFLIVSLYVVAKAADYATQYSSHLASSFHLSKYAIGFLVVAVISILPETFISITSAIRGEPSFGLGVLFGSNVADLTLVFAAVIFASQRDLKIESKIIQNIPLYLGVLSVPILFGLNGYYSRFEGAMLVVLGCFFHYLLLKKGYTATDENRRCGFAWRDLGFLVCSMVVLLLASNLTVSFGTGLATSLGISPVLIAMLVVALGTTLPELSFSIRAAKKKDDGLALGDILGTVISDATIVVGVIALIHPFAFSQRIVYVTGMFMVLAAILLLHFMKTGRTLTRREGFLLTLFYLAFVITEFTTSNFLTAVGGN